MLDHPTSLDLNRLECPRQVGDKIIAQCPACAAEGGDNKWEHLVIYPDGRWGCVLFGGKSEGSKKHRSLIFARAGKSTGPSRNPIRDREWREKQVQAKLAETRRVTLVSTAKHYLCNIVQRHPWAVEDVIADSPHLRARVRSQSDPRVFLPALFGPHDLIWTGAVRDTGRPAKARHWKTCAEWTYQPLGSIGPMVTPATWKPSSISRSGPNVLSRPYVVLDFDEIDGVKPRSSDEKERLQARAFSIIRWLRESRAWGLAAIIMTGGKGVQAWFHHPSDEALESLKAISSALGLDAGLLGAPEHPCRLPGQIHPATGVPSFYLWLQLPVS